MAIELHHLHPGHDDELSRLKQRIAELERMDTEHTLQIAKMNGYIHHLEEERRWRKCIDEMPEEDKDVLFSDGNYIYLGCWTTWDGGCSDYSYETFSGWVESGSEDDYDFNEIKYWMPLPSAPKEDK